ncbi:hypothetical protein GCM10023063_21100 [Arthrobacter methylotrophus]|uniref:Zf-HC2 domain-containing protein n=1 Tax=Arthrobacter methylotrophus TaxID=121291 RepID=A0ABV5UVY3_9MICC
MTTDLDSLTDGELLEAVRAGNGHAYGILFGRHKDAALRVARRQTPDRHLAEDAVNEAFAAVLSAIHGGSGPVGVFGPYLLSSVTRTVYRMNHRSMRETPVLDTAFPDVAAPETHTVLSEFDNAAAREAFKALPARWREVLWYLEIEEMQPRDAGPLLGLSPNATVALHRRAKDGLRLGYLQQHVAVDGPDNCRDMASHIPAYVLGTLKQSRKAALERHLESCEKCGTVLLQIQDVAVHRAAILPALTLSPLSQICPSSERKSTDPDAPKKWNKDTLLTIFTTVMIASALVLGSFSFLAPTSAEQGQVPLKTQGPPTSDPASPQSPALEAQFDVLSHSANQVVANVKVQFPDNPTTTAHVELNPGSGHAISQITPDPANGWTCTTTANGTVDCRAPELPSSHLVLTLKMDRPPCPSGTPVSLLVSLNDVESLQQSWQSPCAGN